MYVDNSHEELSRQSLVNQAAAINRSGRAFLRQAEAAARNAATRRQFTETHGIVGQTTLNKVAQHVWFGISLMIVYVLDVILFGGPAQYMTTVISGESGFMSVLAKYAFPACFIVIEVLIAVQIERARHEERFAFGSSAKRWAWFSLGALVALVMPLTARALAESAGMVDNTNVSASLVGVLAIISFAAHVLILFGGQAAEEAKAYLLFLFARWFHRSREATTENRAHMTLAKFNSQFITYVHAWRQHNRLYTPMPSGPFDAEIVQLLKRQFPEITNSGNEDPDDPEE
jgi:hypothetical protein